MVSMNKRPLMSSFGRLPLRGIFRLVLTYLKAFIMLKKKGTNKLLSKSVRQFWGSSKPWGVEKQ